MKWQSNLAKLICTKVALDTIITFVRDLTSSCSCLLWSTFTHYLPLVWFLLFVVGGKSDEDKSSKDQDTLKSETEQSSTTGEETTSSNGNIMITHEYITTSTNGNIMITHEYFILDSQRIGRSNFQESTNDFYISAIFIAVILILPERKLTIKLKSSARGGNNISSGTFKQLRCQFMICEPLNCRLPSFPR